ncbi:hypothetical protein EMIT0P12_20758 [Pseudomonas sp. IT-P12]
MNFTEVTYYDLITNKYILAQ